MTTDRRIYLGMPGYGKQTADAGRSFWRACRDMSQVSVDYRSGSLLACNFNQLWCGALNLVHQGEQLDYFAMIHDDIGAEDFWLDRLIDELEAKQLDVLGVAIPIKDTRGLTSLALHREGDNWMPLCRLSMHDVYELPETFTSDDLGHPLLLNTGLWVCKFDMNWARQVHFTINDEIVFNTAQNRYQSQTEPEDWFFSRLCHELGLKLGVTRKIHAIHRGEMDFTNTRAWGSDKFDHESCKISPVKNAFPRDVDGWIRPEEGRALAELAKGKRVLEIGSYCGLSTICMARTAAHVTAVDYFDGRATPFPGDTLPQFRANVQRYGVADKVTSCHPDCDLPLDQYDMAFIDGAHDVESVQADIEKCLSVLAPDGFLVFHDYKSATDPGVTEAVDEFLASGAELISTHASIAVVRPPAEVTLEV